MLFQVEMTVKLPPAMPADEAAAEAEAALAREGRVARTMDRLAAGERLGDITGINARIADLKDPKDPKR